MFAFLRHKEKVTIDDPVFGLIEFSHQHSVGLWCHVSADAESPMVLVEAPQTGPTQTQRDFFRSLRRDLHSRLLECRAFIAKLDGASPNLSQMNVYSVEIGSEAECAAGQFVIELSDEQADEIHRVGFRNWKPDTYGVDD